MNNLNTALDADDGGLEAKRQVLATQGARGASPPAPGCSKVGPGHSKPETRRPKAEVRIDSHPGGAAANRIRPFSEFGFRPAFGFRPSVFGFQGGRTGSSLNWPDFSAALPPAPAPLDIPQFIDHTLLRPDATRSDIEQLCREARQHLFYSVCVNPTWVSLAGRLLDESGVKVCCVVSFPLGAQLPETKALEARAAIRQGAKEIDMVLNVGALKSGDDALVLQDIRSVVEACRDGSARGKVILETSLLTNEEKGRACELAGKAQADFVKTSTGFSTGGATIEDVALMSRIVREKGLEVKASGGIRSLADLRRMVPAGATRIGTGSGIKILLEAAGQAGGSDGAKY